MNINEIAIEFMSDAIAIAKEEHERFGSWQEFVELSFMPCEDDGILPGFDSDKKVAAVLSEDKETAAECLPLADNKEPCAFLVFCVKRSALGLSFMFAEQFKELKE